MADTDYSGGDHVDPEYRRRRDPSGRDSNTSHSRVVPSDVDDERIRVAHVPKLQVTRRDGARANSSTRVPRRSRDALRESLLCAVVVVPPGSQYQLVALQC